MLHRLLAISLLCATPALALLADRPGDPVVLRGSQLPGLLGEAPGAVVAFRWDGGDWLQIPVQVDERDLKRSDLIRNNVNGGNLLEVFCDPALASGVDSDPMLDANDEIVFMARDAGAQAPAFSSPVGMVPGTAVALQLTDPLDGDDAWVYLFVQSIVVLDPGAGAHYVDYQVDLLGDLPYGDGPHPENSVVLTPNYRVRFNGRWVADDVGVTAGGATGVDLLDRRKITQVFTCGSNEQVFSDGQCGFYVNRVGPVRALRGYIGAESGPETQREHAFYDRREDIRTNLRVHPIAGLVETWDYAATATGMTYTNNNNLAGVIVDGLPDAVAGGELAWESLTGPQGTLVHVHGLETNFGVARGSAYEDDVTPSPQCTGDGVAYAASGPSVFSFSFPDTSFDTGNFLTATRTVLYDAPGASGAALAQRALNPLSITPSFFVGPDCGNGALDAGEECDDGDALGDDCCDANCRWAFAGTACNADGNACTIDACDGGAACALIAPVVCGVCERCDTTAGCVVEIDPTCREPLAAGKSTLSVQRKLRGLDTLTWKWGGGPATPAADFGDPVNTTTYTLCGFDAAASPARVILARRALPSATWLGKGKPVGSKGWKRKAGLFGETTLMPGTEGKARISLKRQEEIPLSFVYVPPVRVELRSSDGLCWASDFGPAGVLRNDATAFKAKSTP
ncbi:MAG TPA: hypothetical protein VGR62_17305 [Candidatus Binatia bacterium]|jgi:hypothetical protein|nr:hypothetical protein [Candidatus Binatia bacterium]